MKSPYKPDLVDYSKSSTKRKKPSDSASSLNTPSTTITYSTRTVIPWKEQSLLGEKFRSVGKGNWPVLRISDERGQGKKREYLVEWEEHPLTGEVFQPSWVRKGIPCEHVDENIADPTCRLPPVLSVSL